MTPGPHRTAPVHTSQVTGPIADAAARSLDLDPDGMILLRHQTSGVYQLTTAPVVIKVAPPGEDHIADVVALVSWLQQQGVPTVELWGDPADQPLLIDDRVVTLWRYLPQERAVRAPDIAASLRALHEAPAPPFSIRHLDAFSPIRRSIASSPLLTDDDRALLADWCDRLTREESTLSVGSTPSLIHGDAQHRNTLLDHSTGLAVLSDWDSAVIGPREWDLTTIEVHCRRFAHPPNEYDEFCYRYGRDVRNWAGYSWLRDVRELRMITSNARKSPPGSPAAAEVRRRLEDLHAGRDSTWNIL